MLKEIILGMCEYATFESVLIPKNYSVSFIFWKIVAFGIFKL